MSKTARDQQLYRMIKIGKEAIKSFPDQGHSGVCFTAQFQRKGEKTNSIQRGATESFDKLVRSYYHNEQPDSVKIEFMEGGGKTIWTRVFEFTTDQPPVATLPQAPVYMGLGEAEVNEIVRRKVDAAEELRLFKQAQTDVQTLTEKLQVMENEKKALEQTLAAKENLEFYSKIIGVALPGLSQFLSATAIGPAISMLAGTGNPQQNATQAQQQEPQDERASIVAMITEFCYQLTEQELASVYLVFAEMERDRTNIQKILSFITQNNHVR